MNLRSPVVGRFAQEVSSAIGSVRATIDTPVDPNGLWFLDLEFEDRRVIVQQHVRDGYLGVSRYVEPMSYGEKPDRTFTEFAPALAHTLHLLVVTR